MQLDSDVRWSSANTTQTHDVSPSMMATISKDDDTVGRAVDLTDESTWPEVTLLDYGAGNVRSIRNAIRLLRYRIKDVKSAADISSAQKLIFPGVGNFGSASKNLQDSGLFEPLREYILAGRPYLGICIGMQILFSGSDEAPEAKGLNIIPGTVKKFTCSHLSVPHMGWNVAKPTKPSGLLATSGDYNASRVYFVHSYRAEPSDANQDWVLSLTDYGGDFISSVHKGAVCGTQFHPEKSSVTGLSLIQSFLNGSYMHAPSPASSVAPESQTSQSASAEQQTAPDRKEDDTFLLAKRIIACLDVRANDAGDLVVTKGDQYDVRESKADAAGKRDVRNLGKPVELARRYYDEGADEVTFLNITSFRDMPLKDLPMLKVLEEASKQVFVPLTVGGGIRDFTDPDGTKYSALDVAARYFRAGADKVSIGSDAVLAAEAHIASGGAATQESSITQIARVYGRQAVVISVDPKRVYVSNPDQTKHHTIKTTRLGPAGEEYCWYQCTINGGRISRDLDVVELVVACEAMGAGEILLNCMDMDGTKQGFDLELIKQVCQAVSIPVIASSGAGTVEHFSDVFDNTAADAALAAGIFHRREVPLSDVKNHLTRHGVPVRPFEQATKLQEKLMRN